MIVGILKEVLMWYIHADQTEGTGKKAHGKQIPLWL